MNWLTTFATAIAELTVVVKKTLMIQDVPIGVEVAHDTEAHNLREAMSAIKNEDKSGVCRHEGHRQSIDQKFVLEVVNEEPGNNELEQGRSDICRAINKEAFACQLQTVVGYADK